MQVIFLILCFKTLTSDWRAISMLCLLKFTNPSQREDNLSLKYFLLFSILHTFIFVPIIFLSPFSLLHLFSQSLSPFPFSHLFSNTSYSWAWLSLLDVKMMSNGMGNNIIRISTSRWLGKFTSSMGILCGLSGSWWRKFLLHEYRVI